MSSQIDTEVVTKITFMRAGQHNYVAALSWLEAAYLLLESQSPCSLDGGAENRLLVRRSHNIDSKSKHSLHILAVAGTGIEIGCQSNVQTSLTKASPLWIRGAESE